MSAQAVIDALRAAPGQALLATELQARLAGCDVARPQADAALGELERAGRVLVAAHPPPDVHLIDLDLRTVALVPSTGDDGLERARQAAEERWNGFLRAYLATHRCC